MPTAVKPQHKGRNATPLALTRAKQQTYLQQFSLTGSHAKACTAAQIDLSTPKQWSYKSELFQKAWDRARELGEAVVLSRYETSMDAVCLENPEVQQNPETYAKIQNSMFFRMKRLDPRYRDNAPQVNIVTGALSIVSTLDDQRPALPAKLIK